MDEKDYFELWANNSLVSKRIKESLLEKGLEVKHILTASTTPVLKNKDYYTVGVGKIILNYSLSTQDIF